MVVTLEPYDSVYVGDVDCPGLPGGFLHTVHVTFPAPGMGTLRVIGRGGTSLDLVAIDTVLNVQ
jgi:hypothetical protein